jgi:excisionase family DNA binding protein
MELCHTPATNGEHDGWIDIGEVTMEEKRTVSVPEAGKWLGIGRNAAYEAARRGEIPTIKIGRLLRVPVVALERKLEVSEGRAS